MTSSLRSGTTLSHYRVLSPLGAGGMGEVYKAQDTVLGRTIALKVLPPELVRNDERVRRFIQEARSASSLSHPHIVTVHEIGEAAVQPAGEPDAGAPAETSVHFIAMEFVDGDTLRTRIHHEKTDLRALLVYLAQAAEGLAKAHAAGIVHRDLKPDNIMVSRDGYAKVLDFGLAKLREAGSPAVGLSTATPAAGAAPTRAGTVLGTVGYMSPEQVQGKEVDSRSDIFSFGCILYEAATRQRPFEGDSDIDVMHKILHDKPAPVDQLNPAVPAELKRLIRRCLAKDPEQRYQSMKDLAIELNDLVEEWDQLSPASSSSGSPAQTVAPPPRRGAGFWLGAAAAGLVLLAALYGAYTWSQRRSRERGASTFHTMKITSLTGSGTVREAAISPDGKYVVQAVEEAGKQSLWIRQVATASDVQIVPPGPPFAGIAFAPGGDYIYFTRNEKDVQLYALLYQVPVLGGPPRKLIFDVDTPVTFSPDGKEIAFARGYPAEGARAIMIARADGTGERKLAVRKQPESYALSVVAWSPDGRTIAAVAASLEGGAHEAIVTVDTKDGKERPIGSRRWVDVDGLAWLPDASALVVVALLEESRSIHEVWLLGHPGGAVRKITNDLNDYHGVSLTADSRTLVTVQISFSSNLWLAPSPDGAGARQLGLERNEFVQQIRWSKAGPIIYRAMRSGSIDLWMCDADGANPKRLTTESQQYGEPVLASDGSFILCTSLRNGGVPHVWRLDPDGGNPTQVTSGAGEILADLSADSKWLLYSTVGAQRGLWKMPVAGGPPVEIARSSRGGALFSRDGKHILHGYLRSEGGRFVTAAGIVGAAGGELVWSYDAPEGVGELRWAPTSDALTYIVTRDGVSNIWRQPLGSGAPAQITDFKSGIIFSFDWSPDGKRLALARGETVGDAVLVSDFR
jgi:serine/threonine protein kinase/Tol biopolymer transport system component